MKMNDRSCFLKEKTLILGDKECLLKMFFENIVPKDNISEYVYTLEMPKLDSISDDDIINLKNLMDSMLNSLKVRKLEYIPYSAEISNTDDGCLDVFYDIEDMNEAFDRGHITEEGAIGKEILRIGVEYEDSNNIILQMSMKSLLILDDKYEVSSIWNIFEDYVLSFFIDEMKRLLVKQTN